MIIARRKVVSTPGGGSGPELLTMACSNEDSIGDLVGLVGTGQVSKADVRNRDTLPVIGVIVSKPSPEEAVVQTEGTVRGIYLALHAGGQYVLGQDGRPAALPLWNGDGTQRVFVQKVGVAVDSATLNLQISPDFVGVYL